MELQDKFEIKVFILFLLNNLEEPLEFTTVNDIVIQDGFVNYFDFAICFAELLEAGQITETAGSKPLYAISDIGRTAIESYESTLYNSVREKALRSALRLLAFNRSGSKINSRITETKGGYTLKCVISDNERILFNTEVFLTEKHYAEKLKANFDERAEIIYKGTLALLSGDVNFIFDE
ncbi:MAG: hypothetical protein CVU97_01180 [Firmicutes bacterium HGW-Firmicutes-21]|nr:MAG: hypothetical protein CVU97_01180 [Firmicutes bacterium HGW-Firmicutes-21]